MNRSQSEIQPGSKDQSHAGENEPSAEPLLWAHPTLYPLSAMTATNIKRDDKGRITLSASLLPRRIRIVSAERQEDGRILLTPLVAPPAAPKPRLVRRKGYPGVFVSGLGAITADQVKAIVEEEL